MTNDDKEAKVTKRKTRGNFGNLPCKTTTKKTRNLRYINKNRGEKYKLTVFVSLNNTSLCRQLIRLVVFSLLFLF